MNFFNENIVSIFMGFLACVGYCLVSHVPKKCIFVTSAGGCLGWTVYTALMSSGTTKVMAAFLASVFIAFLGDFLSRVMKEAVTIFIIPGIIPFVPGSGMYYTMLAFIEGDSNKAGSLASETFFVAGAIAMGLLVVGYIIKLLQFFLKAVKLSR